MTEIETELAQLDLERKRLELAKLRAEIDETSLAWWKRPGYLGGLTPIVLALVGVGTAWVTGFFDTQRQELAAEISLLEQERASLSQSVEEAQRAIDSGYLQAKLAGYDADYALGHFNAFSEEFGKAAVTMMLHRDSLHPDVAAAVSQMMDVSAQRFNVVEITEDSIVALLDRLEQIDASPWAKELTTDPMLSSQGLLIAGDGRLFNVTEFRFLNEAEAALVRP